MTFKIKVIAEAKAVENSSEITRDCGLGESMVRRWRRDQATILSGKQDACKTYKNWPFHCQVSQTRRASEGVVLTLERPNISFVM